MSILLLIPLQHANGENAWTGIDGNSGEIADMKELKVHSSFLIPLLTFCWIITIFYFIFSVVLCLYIDLGRL